MEERACFVHPNQLEAPAAAITENKARPDDAHSSSSDDGADEHAGEEFEFPFLVSRDDSPAGSADELFAEGRIRPFYYPVFGHGSPFFFGQAGTAAQQPTTLYPATPAPRVRGQLGRLFLEESRARSSSASSSSSSDVGELEPAPESYCLWTPGASALQRPPRKSGSTGSVARWRRISDLVVGRSHSDGKDKFVSFFPAAAPPPRPNKPTKATPAGARRDDKPKPNQSPAGAASAGVRKASPAEVDAAHRAAYGATTPRRTFLPYREELMGLFANVNGVSRSQQHPF